MGTFCDEIIYQKVLALKCNEALIKAQREVEILVTYEDFSKTYKIDLLLNSGVVYELKTVKTLNAAHRQQLINYLLLTGLKHGKLLNFRSSSVACEYVSTSLTPNDRYNYTVDSSLFSESTTKCATLKNTVYALLREWGAYLDFRLYNEALVHLLGGSENVVFPVDILFETRVVGRQQMQLLDNQTAFHLSSIGKAQARYERSIHRLIKHTGIKSVQWVNFNRENIVLKTLNNEY